MNGGAFTRGGFHRGPPVVGGHDACHLHPRRDGLATLSEVLLDGPAEGGRHDGVVERLLRLRHGGLSLRFHEDGALSGLQAARKLGVDL